jgi:glycosyltransferase involved in cell wall biosynthesis
MSSRDGKSDNKASVGGEYDPALRIAVLVPCYNEAKAIHGVVTSFREALPLATIFVYDNNSRDHTGEIAMAAGAVVRHTATDRVSS